MRQVEVSVLCLAYNHEKFIRDCLNSIVEQETNFEIEVIVHDDSSTDGTQEVIKEFEHLYPDKIKPIFQKKNLYSQGISIIEEVMLERANGKYVAFCECDDKWTDKSKLQRQYDYMEKHSNCSLCTHNTIIHNLDDIQHDRLFNNWKREHMLTEKEVFIDWKVHTSSFFVRKQDAYRPKEFRDYWFGDYVRLTYAFTKGAVVALPFTMSQYNYGVKTGVLNNANSGEVDKKRNYALLRCDYLSALNQKSNGQYRRIITKRILMNKLEADTIIERDVLKYSTDKKEITKVARDIVKKKAYKEYFASLSFLERIKEIIRYKGYFIFPIWIKMWRK